MGRERAGDAGAPAARYSSRCRSGWPIPAAFEEAKRSLEADKRFTVDVHRESEFYAQQSQLLGNILRILAILITSIMAVGAIFGAVNTMYAAVSSRMPEIAVLLTLGLQAAERAGELPDRVGARSR